MLAAAAAKEDSARKRAKFTSTITCESVLSTHAHGRPAGATAFKDGRTCIEQVSLRRRSARGRKARHGGIGLHVDDDKDTDGTRSKCACAGHTLRSLLAG